MDWAPFPSWPLARGLHRSPAAPPPPPLFLARLRDARVHGETMLVNPFPKIVTSHLQHANNVYNWQAVSTWGKYEYEYELHCTSYGAKVPPPPPHHPHSTHDVDCPPMGAVGGWTHNRTYLRTTTATESRRSA